MEKRDERCRVGTCASRFDELVAECGATRPMDRAIRASAFVQASALFVWYEPGNATRYDVVITKIGLDAIESGYLVAIANMRKCVTLPSLSGVDPGYLASKLSVNLGDAVPLVQLLDHVATEFAAYASGEGERCS